jgi:energy-coupling factor transporter ATP-binding protein EcfA2
LSDGKGKSVMGHAFDAIEEANKRGWLDRVKEAFKKRHQVIVLGTTGVGKTNFLESLKSAQAEAVEILKRTEFIEKNKVTIEKELFTFIDTPGQVGSEERRELAVRDALKSGATGIINVVAYGYHEYPRSLAEVFDAQEQIRPDFLVEHRKRERDALAGWADILGSPQSSPYLITVVNKADLWWNQHTEVTAYYQEGEYFTALGRAQSLKPVVLPYCSVFHKFYGRAPMSGMVDEADRTKLRQNLVHHLVMAVLENRK